MTALYNENPFAKKFGRTGIGSVIFAILLLLPILSSTYLAQELSGRRIPIAIISILICAPFAIRELGFSIRVGLWSLPFIMGAIVASTMNPDYIQSNMRQILYHISLVLCAIPGFIFVKFLHERNINPATYIAVILTLLYLYGVYTYFAQVYRLPIFLNFLRMNPISGLGEIRYYSGWSSGARAYSVWFEPSYAAAILPLSLAILPMINSNTIKNYLMVSMIGFVVLTFSRSAWMVLAMMSLVGSVGLFSDRSPLKVTLFSIYIFLIAAILTFVVQHALDLMVPELSSRIRASSNLQAIQEIIESSFLGTGTPDLIGYSGFRFGVVSFILTHIHNSILSYTHWMGFFGLLFCLLPLIQLLKAGSRLPRPYSVSVIIFSYGMLACITWGGDLINLTGVWFSIGFIWGILRLVEHRRIDRNPPPSGRRGRIQIISEDPIQ